MYNYLFGPVPSRRLGMSLGIDLVPKKVCTFDCVYCEVGKTTKLTLDVAEYILYDRVAGELEHFFEHNPEPDYITFSGSGEPTLNSRIGDVLQLVKQKKPQIPVAVLTNGSLLYRKKLREKLMDADVVLPSLDAATASCFMKLNRPAAGLEIKEYIRGLIDFRKEFKGKIWLEVFILPDYNNGEEQLLALRKAIAAINPDRVQLNTLDRPGVINNLKKASQSELKSIINLWELDNVEIIAAAPLRKHILSYREDMESAILETISRRPCTLDDLTRILGIHINEINKYLDVLEAETKIEAVVLDRGVFYRLRNR
jgi:wyosine [tRNA(Phe)-imidazoG37] synthetase (radical SAM superfamily)